MKKELTLLIVLGALIVGRAGAQNVQKLVDDKATKKTRALYSNLKKLSERGFMFGHQDDAAYGVSWQAIDGRSDVKDVCGSFPGLFGWDIGKIGKSHNIDGVKFDSIRYWIKSAYKRGAVNTVSWHIDNPVTKGGSWDKTPAVKEILPGGKFHSDFIKELDNAADFLKKCKAGLFTKIPIIFRPWHEHNGDWFWWGKGNCTEEEYIQLWRFTVDYLKNKKGLHHLIYAFSPDRSRLNMDSSKVSYLYGYPGDDQVDLLGIDNYLDVGAKWNQKPAEVQRTDYINSLRAVSRLALEKNKVAALTETGQETIRNAHWFSEAILNPLKENRDIKIAYVMVWRNANPGHCYAPYPGHPAVEDFKKFYEDELTAFENDMKNMYKLE